MESKSGSCNQTVSENYSKRLSSQLIDCMLENLALNPRNQTSETAISSTVSINPQENVFQHLKIYDEPECMEFLDKSVDLFSPSETSKFKVDINLPATLVTNSDQTSDNPSNYSLNCKDKLDMCTTMDFSTTESSELINESKNISNEKSNFSPISDENAVYQSSSNNIVINEDKTTSKSSATLSIEAYTGHPFDGKIHDFSLVVGKPIMDKISSSELQTPETSNYDCQISVSKEENLNKIVSLKKVESHLNGQNPVCFGNLRAILDNENDYKEISAKSSNSSIIYNLAQFQLLKFKEARDYESRIILLQQHCMRMLKNISMTFSVWANFKNSYMWHSDIILNASSIKQLAIYALIFDDIENDCASQYNELQQATDLHPDDKNHFSNNSNTHMISIFNQLFNFNHVFTSNHLKAVTQLEPNLFLSMFAQVNPYTITQCLLHLDHVRQQIDASFRGIEDLQPFTATFITTQAVHAAQQPPIQFFKGILTRFKSYTELTNVRNVKRKTNAAYMYLVPTNSKQSRSFPNDKLPMYVTPNYPPQNYDSMMTNNFDQYSEITNNQSEDDHSIEDHTRIITQIFLSNNNFDESKKIYNADTKTQTAETAKKDAKDLDPEAHLKIDSESANLSRLCRNRMIDSSSKLKYRVSNNTPEMLIPAVLCSPKSQTDVKNSPQKIDQSDANSDKSSKTTKISKGGSRKSADSKVFDLPENVEAFRSQVKGVYYDDTSNRWCASWHERKTGKKRSRYFAVKKFGFNNAKSHAMDARLEAEESGECAPTNRV